MAIRVFHRDTPTLRLPLIAKDARFVIWLGVGAETANMNYVVMEPGEANVPHTHAESEDTIFVLEGEGEGEGEGSVADHDTGVVQDFRAGQVIHVPAGVQHAVRADKGAKIVSVGGPCPADKALLKRTGVLPDGYDIDSV